MGSEDDLLKEMKRFSKETSEKFAQRVFQEPGAAEFFKSVVERIKSLETACRQQSEAIHHLQQELARLKESKTD